ncbi:MULTISPECIES: hypothetical protein [Streptomyces]|uniref:hypothetical protein n=1 Tax=Streptomyces TaxID=1883 RepID=UPI001682D24B|nr:hypothetical protein [Streptomyces venezuelae]
MLKMLDECGQVVLFAGLGVLMVLTPPWGGFWRWAAFAAYVLMLLGACRGAVRAWRKWRRESEYSAAG